MDLMGLVVTFFSTHPVIEKLMNHEQSILMTLSLADILKVDLIGV